MRWSHLASLRKWHLSKYLKWGSKPCRRLGEEQAHGHWGQSTHMCMRIARRPCDWEGKEGESCRRWRLHIKTWELLVVPGDFPGNAAVGNPPANGGDPGDASSVPGSGRSPVGGNDNPLQYSCLANPTVIGAWQTTIHGFLKSQTWLARLSKHACWYFGADSEWDGKPLEGFKQSGDIIWVMVEQVSSGSCVENDHCRWGRRRRLVWKLLQWFGQDMMWLRLLWWWRKWLDSGCILRMEPTEFADSLNMETKQGRERREFGPEFLAGLIASNWDWDGEVWDSSACVFGLITSLYLCSTNQVCGILSFDYDS